MVAVNDRLAEANARIGTVLRGKWRLERLLGVGGMAAVYEARHKNHNRVAVKILHRRLGLSPEQVTRFQREGYAANRVGHQGVVEVYDDDVDEQGSAFLVMEFLSGQSVAERAAARGRLAPEEVLDVAARVLDVLAAAHAQGILHRDIKPENLFLTTTGELKVLDFGIARLVGSELGASSTEAGTLLGTPAFLPPEQARGLVDSIDARTDLWAVGATMFTLLTGRFVHEARTPNEQVGHAITASARSLADVMPEAPAALVEVVDRALAYSQDARWKDARTMQEAVRWTLEHWAELAASPDLVPETWSAESASHEGGTADTLENEAGNSEIRVDENPVSSTLPSRPRSLTLGTVAVSAAVVASAIWMASLAFRHSESKPRAEARLSPSTAAGASAYPVSPVVEPRPTIPQVSEPSATPPPIASVGPPVASDRPRSVTVPASHRAAAPAVRAAAVLPGAHPTDDRDLDDRRY